MTTAPSPNFQTFAYRAQTIEVPSDLRRALTAGSTLAISLEPVGGSPQGVPTGPIVAKGSITST